jgi:hypothetical protein
MLIHFQTEKFECRFFDRFDAEARAFEDGLRGGPRMVGSLPWPRVSFWQGYRHLQSISKKYFILQMTRKETGRSYQMAVVEQVSRFGFFKKGAIPYWIPSPEPESFPEQAELLRLIQKLCRERTSFMSLRLHVYIPGDPALDAAEKLMRESGFAACDPEAPGMTRIVDLSPPIEEVFSQFTSKIRTKLRIKKAEEVGVEEIKSREQIPELQSALNDSFNRSTSQEYNYDFEGLFKTIENSPEAIAALGFYLSDEPNSPKAFVTGVASPPLFEYAIAGSRSNARLRQFPFNYILLWRLMEAAKVRGASVFDMGGITDGGPDDPLAGISDFKRRFPGFEIGIGREGLSRIRPLRCRLFDFLRFLKYSFSGKRSRVRADGDPV